MLNNLSYCVKKYIITFYHNYAPLVVIIIFIARICFTKIKNLIGNKHKNYIKSSLLTLLDFLGLLSNQIMTSSSIFIN